MKKTTFLAIVILIIFSHFLFAIYIGIMNEYKKDSVELNIIKEYKKNTELSIQQKKDLYKKTFNNKNQYRIKEKEYAYFMFLIDDLNCYKSSCYGGVDTDKKRTTIRKYNF